jgi:hypothetical protein
LYHVDHPVGTRRNPEPLPFGFVAATDYTRLQQTLELERRFRTLTPEQQARMSAAMPGATVRPYPLVAESPFAGRYDMPQAPKESDQPGRHSQFNVGVASVGAGSVDGAIEAEEVNTMSPPEAPPRSASDTWVDYAMTSTAVSATKVTASPLAPPTVRSAQVGSFYRPAPVETTTKETGRRWQGIAAIVACLMIVVGVTLIVTH